MALTLIKRPIGHKLNSTDVEAVIIDDGTGDALVYTTVAHGLSDGDYIYIESNLDSYNGFKYVDSIAYDSFKIKDSEQGDFTEYVQDADISYRTSVHNHGWQAVHLPIVYELESDLWPNNIAEEAYTPNTIVSREDNNGNTQLNLLYAITPTPVELNFIELVGDNIYAGPYQIIEVLQPWSIVINLAYDGSVSFATLQVVNYYNNYAINVEVWAGLSSDHRWVAKKPYEQADTLKFIPDSDGKIKFSIADILKGYITTRNNLTLDTLPNNLDFHVSFYIKYYESYDQSDGEDITTFDGEVTTDDFEGHAINSMMPFKSLNSGHMSDYLNEGDFLARWLTLMDRPLMIVDRFFDISFINQYNVVDILITKNGESYLSIPNPGSGIIRVPIIPVTGETEVCLIAYANGDITLPDLSLWLGRSVDPILYDWTLGPQPTVNLPGAGSFSFATSETIYIPYIFNQGFSYTVSITYNRVVNSGTDNPRTARISIFDLDFNEIEFENQTASAGSNTISITFIADSESRILGFSFSSGSDVDITINSTQILFETFQITERICCDVVDECSPTFINDILRITEASILREIE